MKENNTMKIKVLNTEDGFDPNATCTEETLESSLNDFEDEVLRELTRVFPGSDVEFFRSIEHPDSPTGGKSLEVTDETGIVDDEVVREIEEIIGSVYETGTFWN